MVLPHHSSLAIPYLEDNPNQCGENGFSIFPKTGSHHTGSGTGTEYDCVLPIGVLYHCLRVSTATQCIFNHQSPAPHTTSVGGNGGSDGLGGHINSLAAISR